MRISTPLRYAMLLWLLLLGLPALAQVVTTDPTFPTADKPVTLTFDISKSTHSKKVGLLTNPEDIYLWSGAGTTEAGDAFEYQPDGQNTWTAPFAPGKMTYLGESKWQITLTPRSYYGVPDGTPIAKLGLLLKNGNGSAQTEDLIIAVYPDELRVNIEQPTQETLFVPANSTLLVRVGASEASTIRLLQNDVELTRASNATSLNYSLQVGAERGARYTVTAEASTATETSTDVFHYIIEPEPSIAELPAGAQDGVTYVNSKEVILTLFAPQKNNVYVIGEFNEWQPSQPYLMNRTPDGERFWLRLTGLPAGQEVAYQYLVDGEIAVADPYAEKILDPQHDKYLTDETYPNLKPYPSGASGIVSVLQTQQQPYTWQVTDFERPAVDKLVVYELLVRDFVATRNYKELTEKLDYLKDLGINAIELMPVMEFSGNESWGYNPIFFFAPDKAYGTEEDLKAFIDAAHAKGMAVILDIVLNQADYEYPYVKLYWNGDRPAANNPYFNEVATHPYNVFFDFNHESEATKALVQRVTEFWLEEYNVDGFRFDLSKGFTQKNTGDNVGAWSAYDASRVATWKRIYNEIRKVDESAYVILEHFADNGEEKELANYGMLFWGNSNHDFRQLAKGENANPNWISYRQRAWQKPHVVGYIESHDEERLMYDVLEWGASAGDYNTQELSTGLNRAKLAAAFGLLVPGPKMIWQFGELGYDISIDYNGRTGNKPLHWEYLQDEERRKLYQVYAELINLKTSEPVFATNDFNLDYANTVKRLTLANNDMQVFMVGNFDVKPQQPQAAFPQAGTWYDYFTGQAVQVSDPMEKILLQPGEFRLYSSQPLQATELNLLPWGNTVLSAKNKLMPAEGLLLYPNPSPGSVMVKLENAYRGQVQLQVLDVTGRVLQSQKLLKGAEVLQQPIQLQGMANGLYYLQVSTGDARMVQKLLKQD